MPCFQVQLYAPNTRQLELALGLIEERLPRLYEQAIFTKQLPSMSTRMPTGRRFLLPSTQRSRNVSLASHCPHYVEPIERAIWRAEGEPQARHRQSKMSSLFDRGDPNRMKWYPDVYTSEDTSRLVRSWNQLPFSGAALLARV
ncbi:unnamed protein product [Protopolystoma xenopodis]|uniref:Uncharacterized protein n=1 Tax=Protopolystoma xenopodis TaxID=117903 RepID=A0A3S5FD19_9PLAT|nr:unnamed protein product [Protopolystoma xenopodis]